MTMNARMEPSAQARPGGGPSSAPGRAGERGLTLIELLVVLVIIGLVAAFAAPQVMGYLGGARQDSARIQISRLSGVLDL